MNIKLNESSKKPYSKGIECPICKSQDSGVTEKRNYVDRIWRRRKCANNHVYTTIETVDNQDTVKSRVSKNYFKPKPEKSPKLNIDDSPKPDMDKITKFLNSRDKHLEEKIKYSDLIKKLYNL
jgi:transcriptional regulator NrdR family protein